MRESVCYVIVLRDIDSDEVKFELYNDDKSVIVRAANLSAARPYETLKVKRIMKLTELGNVTPHEIKFVDGELQLAPVLQG